MDEIRDKKIWLTVPATNDKPDPKIITNPAALTEWLDYLPNIDLEGMIARTSKALAGLNRHPESLTQLPSLLQRFQKAFDDPFELHVVGRGLRGEVGTGRRSAALLNGFLEFNRELSFGYSRLLNDRGETLKRADLINALSLAMESHERDILFSYERYQKVTPRSRLELYRLFLIAEEHGVVNEASEISGFPPAVILNRVLLLNLADPYCLPLQALWSTQGYLIKHAPMASLGTEPGSGLLLDIQGSVSPRLIADMSPSLFDPRRYRYLDTRLLCEATRRHVSVAIKDPAKLPRCLEQLDKLIALHLLRQWHRNWSTPSPRLAQRQEKHNKVAITFGLKALHHYLSKGALTADGTATDSLEDEVILEGGSIYQSTTHMEEFPLHLWRLFNLSEKGAGLIEDEDNSTCSQVGQLALMSIDNPSNGLKPMMAGVIRRRMEDEPHKNEIGIEFLKGQLHPLEVKPLFMEASDPPDFSPALIVDQQDAPALLITLRGYFKPNRALILRNHSQSRRVRAANLTESTRYFDLFSFTVGE